MNDQQVNQQILNAPKQYCDNVRLMSSEEAFLFVASSGSTASVYVFSPAHLKKLSQMILKHITDYEKQFGPIKAEWNPNIPSPFVDLKNPPKNGK